MAAIGLVGISKRFGAVDALRAVSLVVEHGEFLTLLGPSGCGKSTLLRIVAGLERQDNGQVRFDGHGVDHLSPKQRNTAMVFQSYALYPHMSVFDNIALPLVMRRLTTWQRLPLVGSLGPGARRQRAGIAREVDEVARTLGIEALLSRKPRQLSGGQKQRVAVGRAMVRQPSVFLMDEPLSNLDAKLRAHMRTELGELHRRLGATLIYVTHDQVEAMTMSDRVAVMIDGAILQLASPRTIYADPDSLAVAEFVGTPRINVLPGERRDDGGVEVWGVPLGLAAPTTEGVLCAAARPEAIELTTPGAPDALTGRVRFIEDLGPECLVHLGVEGGAETVIVRETPTATLGLGIGDAVGFRLSPAAVLLFDRAGRRLRARGAAGPVHPGAGPGRVMLRAADFHGIQVRGG